LKITVGSTDIIAATDVTVTSRFVAVCDCSAAMLHAALPVPFKIRQQLVKHMNFLGRL